MFVLAKDIDNYIGSVIKHTDGNFTVGKVEQFPTLDGVQRTFIWSDDRSIILESDDLDDSFEIVS